MESKKSTFYPYYYHRWIFQHFWFNLNETFKDRVLFPNYLRYITITKIIIVKFGPLPTPPWTYSTRRSSSSPLPTIPSPLRPRVQFSPHTTCHRSFGLFTGYVVFQLLPYTKSPLLTLGTIPWFGPTGRPYPTTQFSLSVQPDQPDIQEKL